MLFISQELRHTFHKAFILCSLRVKQDNTMKIQKGYEKPLVERDTIHISRSGSVAMESGFHHNLVPKLLRC